MCMSDSSRDNNSGGSFKSLRNRLQTRPNKQSFQADGIKKGFSHISDVTKNMGATIQNMFATKSDASVYSKGVRELDNFGYEKYNIDDDGGEVFITRVPENAMFNDGEPILVRATAGNFVGPSDNTTARIELNDVQAPQEEDYSKFFGNVKRGAPQETEYHATVGKVNDDGSIEPTPTNLDFLNKVRSGSHNERVAPRMEIEDVPVEEPAVPAEPLVSEMEQVQVPEEPVEMSEEPIEFQAVDDIAEQVQAEVQIETPEEESVEEIIEAEETPVQEESEEMPVEASVEVEEPQIAEETFEAPVEEVHAEKVREEFFIEPEDELSEEPAEASVEESSEVEDDDYSWIEIGETDVVDPEEIPAEVQIEPEEIPAEADDVSEEAIVMAEDPVAEPEAPVMGFREEAVEEEQAQVAEETLEVPVEAPVEAPVEETVVAMTLPRIEISEPEGVTGLKVEGSEPSSDSEVNAAVTATEVHEAAVTGAVAEQPKVGIRCSGLTEDGEALPPMSDPVIRRPRSMRFRFNNGVLQNVDSEKVEPREELRDPLA